MATIKIVKELIRLCRAADVALYIWGVHGIGKSSVVRQTAEELGIGFVDFRAAQLEASDLRGLPDKGSDGRTHFLPPADLPAAGEGILLLDELNRANSEVLAAAFQLVLDRRIGQYELPAGWSIVCAGNVDSGDYTVTPLDTAFCDRFCHVLLTAGQTTFDEWALWMADAYPELARDVIGFCGSNLQHLEVVENEDLGFRITPSRRAWEMVTRILRAWQAGDYSERARLEATAGLVGRDLAIAFSRHRAPITPQDVYREGVGRLADKITALARNQKMALMWGIVSWAQAGSLHDRTRAEVVLDFLELMLAQEKDLAVGFCTKLIEANATHHPLPCAQHLALLQNPRLSAAVVRVNREQQQDPTFLDYLVARPTLAGAVAQALSLKPTNIEEVSL